MSCCLVASQKEEGLAVLQSLLLAGMYLFAHKVC